MTPPTSVAALLLASLLSPQPQSPVEPTLTVQVGHATAIERAVFTRDGRFLVTAPGPGLGFDPDGRELDDESAAGAPRLSDRQPLVWDAATGRELRRLETPPDHWVTALAASPDGRWILSGTQRGEVGISELVSGRHRSAASGLGCVLAVAFMADGKRFVAFDTNGHLHVFDTSTLAELSTRFLAEPMPRQAAVGITLDARLLVLVDSQKQGWLFDLDGGGDGVRLRGPTGNFNVAIAPDGSWVAAGTATGEFVKWNVEEGELADEPEALLEKLEIDASTFLVSPDGEVAAIFDAEDDAWDTDGWLLEDEELLGQIDGAPLVFSPDGTLILTTPFSEHPELFSNTVLLHPVEEGEPVAEFTGLVSPLTDFALSADGRTMLVGDLDGGVQSWDLQEGQHIAHVELGQRVTSVGLSANGSRRLASVETFEVFFGPPGEDGERSAPQPPATYVWEDGRADAKKSFPGRVAALTRDGARVVTGDDEGRVRAFDVETGLLLRDFGAAELGTALTLELSVDDALLAASFMGTTVIWELATGRELTRLDGERATLDGSGTRVVTGSDDGEVKLWQLEGRALLRSFPGTFGRLSPGGAVMATASRSRVLLHDARDGELLAALDGHTGAVVDLAFSTDSRFLWSASRDGTLCLYNVATRTQLARTIVFHYEPGKLVMPSLLGRGDDTGAYESWAVVDPTGRFDASNGGNVSGLHWIFGDQVVELEELKEGYYDPGLLAKLLAPDAGTVRKVAAIGSRGGALHPAVEILSEATDAKRVVRARLTNRGGGIGKLRVLVNGRELTDDARPTGSDPQAKELLLEVDLSTSKHWIPGGVNTVELVAANEAGDLQGRGGRRRSRSRDESSGPPPRFHAVIAGVSDYEGGGIDLKYAAKDARDFAAAVELAAKRLHGEERVSVKLLDDKGEPATREGLLSALDELRSAATGDIVLIYLAGHGVTVEGTKPEYYYLCRGASSFDISAPAERARVAISGADLTERIKELAALKVVLILDTCNSGQLIEGMVSSRGDAASKMRSLQRLKDRTGTFVLAGSAADAPSYEATPYGQGLLTYSLLLAMSGARLREDSFVDVLMMFAFARDEVPRLASELRGIQRPKLAIPTASESFDLGQLNANDRAAIPVARKRPVILRTRFERIDVPLDDLGLTEGVNAALRNYAARADEARFVYAETDVMNGALRVAGRYVVVDGSVRLTAWVHRGIEEVDRFELNEPLASLDRLVDAVLRGIAGAVD